MSGKEKATPKVMKLVDERTGKMECKVCGAVHFANIKTGGGFARGSWQCVNGCKLEDLDKTPEVLKLAKDLKKKKHRNEYTRITNPKPIKPA
jgi:hypothetical protein